jgi:hypothetical protein
MIVLPRQARDKHKETLKGDGVFLQDVGDPVEVNPEFVRLFKMMMEPLVAHLRAKGWINRTFAFVDDETPWPCYNNGVNFTVNSWVRIGRRLPGAILNAKTINLPRQARDKHRGNSTTEAWGFLQVKVAKLFKSLDPTIRIQQVRKRTV